MILSYKVVPALLAMFGGWLLGYLAYAIYMVHLSSWERVTDFSAVFFGTGWLALVTVFTFVPFIFLVLRKTGLATNSAAFMGALLLCSQLVLLIPLLLSEGVAALAKAWFFLCYAAIISLAFGVIYLQLSGVAFLQRPGYAGAKLLTTAFIPFFLLFLFYGLPFVSPALAYTYFGDAISDRAVRHVLGRYHVGDKVSRLGQRLPGLVGDNADACTGCSGNAQGGGYYLAYSNGIITELQLAAD